MKYTPLSNQFFHSLLTICSLSSAPLVAVVLVACGSAEDHLNSGYLSLRSAFDGDARQNATMIARAGGDTVWYWSAGDAGTIVWTTSGAERWRSEYAYLTEPHVELAHIDQDSIPDLFWTVDEIGGPVGGMVLLASAGGARTAFVSPTGACLPPLLTDVNRDRRPDMVHYAPGLIGADSCRTFSFIACEERYATEWRQAFVQLDGEFRDDESRAVAFYRQTSLLYLHSAGRLQRFLAALPPDSLSAQVCDSTMVAGLLELSERATHAAGQASPY